MFFIVYTSILNRVRPNQTGCSQNCILGWEFPKWKKDGFPLMRLDSISGSREILFISGLRKRVCLPIELVDFGSSKLKKLIHGFIMAGQTREIMESKDSNNSTYFGFSFERSGAHSSRTIMLEEIENLISYIDNPKANKEDYKKAIIEENCLGKRSIRTRKLTYRHLVDLYSLDLSKVIFRSFLYFWQKDLSGHSLLAFMCSYVRDPILRSSTPFILEFREGAIVGREALEIFIDGLEPGRFSSATLKSTAQNINSSWTKAGHLTGRARKQRDRATPSPGSVSYALLLGFLTGARGKSLFNTEYIKLLDCSFEKAIELAEEAARKGWLVYKRIGDVIEVLFPNLITQEEMEKIYE